MSKLFKKIYEFIDKKIVIPISRATFNTQNSFKRNSGLLEKLLNRPSFLVLFSLFLAVLLFFLTDSKVINISYNNAEVISNVPVNIIYNEEAYVVEGVPETVNITLSGKKSDIYLAKQIGEFSVTLNLEKYTPSDTPYKVALAYENIIGKLSYQLDPSYVYATIKDRRSATHSLSYELINENKLSSKLNVKSVSLTHSEVVVKGSSTTLAKVAKVKALIDLSNKDLSAAGSYNLTDVKMAAFDSEGNVINNVTIVPGNIGATLVLDSYSVSLPVVVKTTGEIVSGRSIASILINNQKEYSITVYGNESEISQLTSIPVTVDVQGAGNKGVAKYNIKIDKPARVRYMSVENLNISLTFGEESQKTLTIGNYISKKNLGNGLSATIITSEDITVTCKGVQSVLNNITEKDIIAYVDLNGLGVGEHTVPVIIDNTNPLVSYIVSSSIKLVITKE